MNERIKAIAQQAGYRDIFDNDTKARARLEKFAELIVRECARVAIKKQTENDMDNIVSKNPAKDFAYALIDHFEIK